MHDLRVQSTSSAQIDAATQRLVQWEMKPSHGKLPTAGEVLIQFERPEAVGDADAVAELAALYHLLEEREVCGSGSSGRNVRIFVSQSAVYQALLKKQLKTVGQDGPADAEISRSAEFLATKYLQATFHASRKLEGAPYFRFDRSSFQVGSSVPRLRFACPLIGAPVAITHHALVRATGRVDQQRTGPEADDLRDVDDVRFAATFRWITRILSNHDTVEEYPTRSTASERARAQKRGTRYLSFPSANGGVVFVVKWRPDGWEMTNVILASQATFLDRPPTLAGQVLIPWYRRPAASAKRVRP